MKNGGLKSNIYTLKLLFRKKREAPLKPSLQGGQNDLIQFLKLKIKLKVLFLMHIAPSFLQLDVSILIKKLIYIIKQDSHIYICSQ